jgi:hypothetical protein
VSSATSARTVIASAHSSASRSRCAPKAKASSVGMRT